jgi:hypothetical protein
MKPVRVLTDLPSGAVPLADLVADGRPALLRGVARDWPLVAAGRDGTAIAHLGRFDTGAAVTGYVGDPAIGGRFFYDAGMTGLNFRAEQAGLSTWLDRIAATAGRADAPSIYLGSTDLDTFLPGLRAECDPGLGDSDFGDHPTVSAWIGNRTVAATHYDMSSNLACCLVGRRRFTLFPPDAIADLYPGPLEPTPAGQVVAMADPRAPDPARFPHFAHALDRAQVAELEPGDMLYYPALWWHQVEALDDLNVMVNWWWNAGAGAMDSPMTTLLHGILSLRDRPPAEKEAWRAMFDYYVFGPAARPAAHLPDHIRGDLGPIDDRRARRLRARIMQRLAR